MSAVARFRLFGRAPAPAAPVARDARGRPPDRWPSPPPAGAGLPWPAAGPATRAARPAPPRPLPTDDPPTDPHGFPPVPRSAARAVPAAAPHHPGRPPGGAAPPWPPLPVPAGGPGPAPGPGPVSAPGAPHPDEAAALAGAFAVDYLSWDEGDPQRRGRVLRDYLLAPGRHSARLGWSGTGRQRAEFALPGRISPDGPARVLVDVRVRVTPYAAVAGRDDRPEAPVEPALAGIPAVAPAPTGPGWRSLPSHWIRLTVPVVCDGGRLVVDAWEEVLGEPSPATDPAGAVDDPLSEPDPAGAP